MPNVSGLVDTLLINGTDLQSLTGVFVQDWSGLWAPGARRGSNDVIPGRPGEYGAELPLDAYTFTVPVWLGPSDTFTTNTAVTAANRAAFAANLAALGSLCVGTNGLVALTRRITTLGGHVDHTCSGQFVGGLNATSANMVTGSLSLQFRNLDGAWTNGTTTGIVP